MKNQDKLNDSFSYKEYLLSGYKGIVVAMLQLTMKDLTIPDSKIQVNPHDSRGVAQRKKEKKYYKHSAYRFVTSEWFEDLCWYIGVEPDLIRRYAMERYNESKKK